MNVHTPRLKYDTLKQCSQITEWADIAEQQCQPRQSGIPANH